MGNYYDDNRFFLSCINNNKKPRKKGFFVDQSKENKITIKYKVNNKNENIRLFGSKFFEKNKNICKILIDFVEKDKFLEFYEVKNYTADTLIVHLEIGKTVSDISYMFSECTSLISIMDLSNLTTNNITDISYIFYECKSLDKLDNDISNWNTNNVNNMSHLFSGCSSLKKLPNISNWNTKNVTDISEMFMGCSSLESLPDISNWNINKVKNLSSIFYECSSLKDLPDISKWKTNNVTNMSYIFYNCFLLKKIPDISDWNTENVTDMKAIFAYTTSLESLPKQIFSWNTKNVVNMSSMFLGCSSIKFLPDIESWNTQNVKDISYLFCKCSSLISLPDISKWNTDNVVDMSYLLYGCSSLESIPDISKWNTNKVINMSYMFYNCSSIKIFPNISKWSTGNVTNMSYMFYNCCSLKELDDISNWNTDKVIDISMMFYNCNFTIPDISKWKCNQNNITNDINNKKENNYDYIEVKGALNNDNVKFIPQIEFKFENVDNYDINSMIKLKEEIKKIIKTDNFSIVKFRKGSLTVAITLQYIVLKVIKNQKNALNPELYANTVNSEVEIIANKLKDHNFISLGTTRPDFVDKEVIDITNEDNRRIIKEKILGVTTNNDINLIQATNEIQNEDFERFMKKISLEADEQETNLKSLIERCNGQNKLFDEQIEEAFKNSVFEYNIINILFIDKDKTQYLKNKKLCDNTVTKLLFHGTNIDAVTGILSSQFRKAKCHIFGDGVYFTDILDYALFYAGERYRKNVDKIPKIGEQFSCVASEIYYDSTKVEKVYDGRKRDIPVEKYGIRCAYANHRTRLLGENELERFKGFIGNEYCITDENQYIPLYGITFERVEYLVIWRDYNFNEKNVNNYPEKLYREMREFHKKIKKFISLELKSRIYYIENTEEALKLIDRKKYNKVIVISNGNNDGAGFIKEARKIIGANTIAAISAYIITKYTDIVKDMENVLLLKGMNVHEKFIECIKKNDVNLYEELRKEINTNYNCNLPEATEDLFNYPKFKGERNKKVEGFNELRFGVNDNNHDEEPINPNDLNDLNDFNQNRQNTIFVFI